MILTDILYSEGFDHQEQNMLLIEFLESKGLVMEFREFIEDKIVSLDDSNEVCSVCGQLMLEYQDEMGQMVFGCPGCDGI